MKLATISTHVLDTSRGEPAIGVRVQLRSLQDDATQVGTTGADGRLQFEKPVPLGGYVLHFDLSDQVLGRPHLFQAVEYRVALDEARHYHVPLLLSPFAVSSYRGS